MPQGANDQAINARLRALPSTEAVLETPIVSAVAPLVPHEVCVECVRATIDAHRQHLLDDDEYAMDDDAIASEACARIVSYLQPSLRRVVNATGVVIHTNLGRAPLAEEAISAVTEVARGYSTLEYDVDTASRGSRHDHVERLLCMLTGAEAAIVVNNNAAAVLLVLSEFAAGRSVVVSRGELVEIGGSFRIPDIMELSSAHLVEVGTTNKTHLDDYAQAIDDDTAMLLKVHPSNYRMVGFTEAVSMRKLRPLVDRENDARRARAGGGGDDVLLYEDQGSGSLVELPLSRRAGEPVVAQALKDGADLVSFSGDKLLGGPQAGIICGRRDLIARLRTNPLVRALRLDKMTLAALEATLRIYARGDEALEAIPVLRMLTEDVQAVRERALDLARRLDGCGLSATVEVVDEVSHAGGGALPACELETYAVCVAFPDDEATAFARHLVANRAVPIVARTHRGAVYFDARTFTEADISDIEACVRSYAADRG